MRKLLKRTGTRTDALFCATDLLRHRRRPLSTPTLTTIFPDKRQIAETAVDRLLARARSKTDLPANDTGFTLNVRESTMGRTSPA